MNSSRLPTLLFAILCLVAWPGASSTRGDVAVAIDGIRLSMEIDNGHQTAITEITGAPALHQVVVVFDVTLASNPSVTFNVPHVMTTDNFGRAQVYFPLPAITQAGEFYARIHAYAIDPSSGAQKVAGNAVHFASRHYSNYLDLQNDNMAAFVAIFGGQAVTATSSTSIPQSTQATYGFVPTTPGSLSGYVLSASTNLLECILPSGPAGVLGTN